MLQQLGIPFLKQFSRVAIVEEIIVLMGDCDDS